MVEGVTEIIIDNAASSAAIDLVNSNLLRLYEVCHSIRIILLAFALWLIICVLYKFFNMFF